jgi:hypothetical protein
VVDPATITATTPAHAAGAVDVVVTNPDTQAGTLTNGFTYTAPPGAPAVSGVVPASGQVTGGDVVTITGTGFVTGATVTFGGVAVTGVTVVDPITITATTPAHAAGPVNVVVTNPDTQTGTLTNGFTYTAPPTTVPTIVPTTAATTAPAPIPTYSPSDSGETLGDFPQSPTNPVMTVTVNIGGDSKAWQAIVTGTQLSGLIVTGTELHGIGGTCAAPPGSTFQYLSLEPARYGTITDAVISFTIPQSWLDENHIDPKSIVLYHMTPDCWQALPTTFLYTKDGTSYFSGQTGAFSQFAIAGTPATAATPAITMTTPQETPTEVVQVPAPAAVAKVPVTAETTAPASPAQAPAKSAPFPLVPVVGVLCCAGIIGGGWYARRWWIRRQNPALFDEYD